MQLRVPEAECKATMVISKLDTLFIEKEKEVMTSIAYSVVHLDE